MRGGSGIDPVTAMSGAAQLATRSDIFSATATGVTLDLHGSPCKYFSLQATGVGGALTLWTILLEISLDGSAWTTLLTHATATLDGITLSGSSATPALYARARATSITLGIGPTAIKSTILAMQ
jgi:hypothetical protein